MLIGSGEFSLYDAGGVKILGEGFTKSIWGALNLHPSVYSKIHIPYLSVLMWTKFDSVNNPIVIEHFLSYA